MSKSYGNFIALTENYLDMYSKLMRLNDEQIEIYFKLLTDVPLSEINQMVEAIKAGSNPMEFKKKLAWTVTAFYHQQSLADKAAREWQSMVQEKRVPNKVTEVTINPQDRDLLSICRTCLPRYSSSELKRLIKQGGITLLPINQKPTDIHQQVNFDQVKTIKIGKKQWFRIKKNKVINSSVKKA